MRALSFGLAVLVAALTPGFGSQSSQPKSVRLADITWPEAEAALSPDAVVVIPLGAGAIEHGRHLKLGNDWTLAEYLTRQVMDRTAVVVAPTLPYHFEPAFDEYPGTISVTLDTAQSLTSDVARTLARFGPRRLYVLNTDTTTTAALDRSVRALAADGILLGYTDIMARLDQVSANIRRQEGGGHADEVETSMMLFIDPGSVDMKTAAKDFSRPGSEMRLTRTPRGRGIYSPTGTWGDPTLATARKGRIIVASLVDAIVSDIEALRRTTPPLPQPAGAAQPAARLAGRPPATDRASGCLAQDVRAIIAVGDKYSVHWANADAESLAGLWSEGGDIIHPDDIIERTRQTIRQNRTEMFNRPEYRASRYPLQVRSVRCVSTEVAVVDGKWELRGVTDATGKPLPTYEGQCTLVLKKTADEWKIEAYRYTAKPSATPLPTWLKRPGWPGK